MKCIKNGINTKSQLVTNINDKMNDKMNENNYDIVFGKLMYDPNIDHLFFKSHTTENIKQITNSTRSIDYEFDSLQRKPIPIPISVPIQISKSDIIKTCWKEDVEYKQDDLVIYNNSLYLCLQSNIKISPSDTTYWQVLIRSQPPYKGIWNSVGYYKSGDIVKYNKIFYISKKESINQKPILEDYWDIFFGQKNNLLLVIFDETYGLVPRENIDEPYNTHEVKSPVEYVRLNSVRYLDESYYKLLDNRCVMFIVDGIYRITYNVTYNGTIKDVQSLAWINAGNNGHDEDKVIQYSIHRSINTTLQDKEYNREDDDEDENVNVINHTFIFPAKKEYKFYLGFKFAKYNIGLVFNLHYRTTWLSIERIGDS